MKQEIIKNFIDYPDHDTSELFIDSLNINKLISSYMKVLTTIGSSIAKLKEECTKIDQKKEEFKENISVENLSSELEFYNANQILFYQKIVERENVKKLIALRYSLGTNKISEQDYIVKRDAILNSFILNRAEMYRTKEWIKYWVLINDIPFDPNYYSQFDIYINGNRRDRKDDLINKSKESRDLYNYVRHMIDRNSLLPNDESIKEVIAIDLILPGIINQKFNKIKK